MCRFESDYSLIICFRVFLSFMKKRLRKQTVGFLKKNGSCFFVRNLFFRYFKFRKFYDFDVFF